MSLSLQTPPGAGISAPSVLQSSPLLRRVVSKEHVCCVLEPSPSFPRSCPHHTGTLPPTRQLVPSHRREGILPAPLGFSSLPAPPAAPWWLPVSGRTEAGGRQHLGGLMTHFTPSLQLARTSLAHHRETPSPMAGCHTCRHGAVLARDFWVPHTGWQLAHLF